MELLPATTAARALEQLAVYSHLPPVRHHLPRQAHCWERPNGTEGGHFRTVLVRPPSSERTALGGSDRPAHGGKHAAANGGRARAPYASKQQPPLAASPRHPLPPVSPR